MTKHPTPKHSAATTTQFTVGYLVARIIEGSFGLHSYLAGAVGNAVGYYLIRYPAP